MHDVTFGTTAGSLRRITGALRIMGDHAEVEFNKSGLFHRGIDSRHVSMLEIAGHENLTGYVCHGDRRIGVDTVKFHDIVKKMDKKAAIDIGISDMVEISGDGRTGIRITDADHEWPPTVPDQHYTKRLVLNLKDFTKTMSRISDVSPHVMLTVTGDSKCIATGSGDSGRIELEFAAPVEGDRNDTVQSYSLEYLLPMLKTGFSGDEIVLSYAEKKPLKLEMPGNITFWLAPRVEN